MSFKDDMNQYRAQQKSGYYTDEEIYQRLIESWISNKKLNIKNYFDKNTSSNHYHDIESIHQSFKFYAASYDKFIHKFKDDLVFTHEATNKNLRIYVENQYPVDMIDYQGNKLKVKDKSGCSLIPTTYVLGKSLDYCSLLDEASSSRARYKEG